MVNKILIGITVFMCGAVVMAFEILGSRLLGPYTGTSVTVWTAIIGIIVAGLSLGYWIGGAVSDKYPDQRILAAAIFIASIFLVFIWLVKTKILDLIINNFTESVPSAIFAALVLFFVPSFLLGTVSPFSARLVIKDVEHSGITAGSVYAISTTGSIAGTFITGFVLIPEFKVSIILLVLASVLALLSFILFSGYKKQS